MIHKIKALHDEGRGLSIRGISKELGMARNTVRTYLRQDAQTICSERVDVSRRRRLDSHRDIHRVSIAPLSEALGGQDRA
jgi:orotate phosphoribosyltransferase-like protein